MSDIAQYTGWDKSASEDSSEGLEGGVERTYFKVPVGRSVVRFVPAAPGRRPLVVTHQHYVELPGRPKVVFNCPLKAKVGPCPVCKKALALKASRNPVDRDMGFALLPKMRAYAVVLDRANVEAGLQVFGFGKSILEGLKDMGDDPDVGDFFRPGPDGFDIVITREGTGKNDTKYSLRPQRQNCELGDMGLIDAAPDLSWFAKVPSLDEIKARLDGDEEAVKAARAAARAGAQGGPQGGPQGLPPPAAPQAGTATTAPWDEGY